MNKPPDNVGDGDAWKWKLLVGFAISIFVIIVIALVTIGVITNGSFVFEKSPSPTLAPTKAPTLAPITSPPTMAPITSPPTFSPTFAPTLSPTMPPITSQPTSSPTAAPIASQPTSSPTAAPITSQPTSSPTAAPIASQPTSSPTAAPIASQPTSSPTAAPTQLQKIGIYSGCYDIAYLYWVTNRWLGSTNDWGGCHGVFPQGESYNNSTQSVFFDKYRPDPSIPMPTKSPTAAPTLVPTTAAPTLASNAPKLYLSPNLATNYPQYTVGSDPSIGGIPTALLFRSWNDNLSGNWLNYPNQTYDMSKGFSFVAFILFFFTSSADWQRVFDFGNGSPLNNILFTQKSNSSTFRFSIFNGTTEYACDGGTITYNTYQKFIGVYDPSIKTIRTFINGEKVGEFVLPLPVTDNRTLSNGYIGRSNWSGDSYTNMNLNYLSIYNRVLTDDEISIF